ncbi:MAG: RNA polymerase sigma factor [Puniceicoccaceae bacterium]
MVTSNLALRESLPLDPDRRIAEAVVEGNHQAYNQLIERYWSRIFARVYQLLGNREDAEEVTQDAFTKAYESLPDFRWEASFSTWLYQIASNLARNRYWYWKRRQRDRGLSLDLPLTEDGFSLKDILPDDEADPGDRMRWNEFQESVEDHLDRLPEAHREIMAMRLLDNLSYEEIGESLEIPIGTVKSRIARARSCLSRSLGLNGESVHGFAQELSRGRS